MERRQAYRLMDAAKVLENVSNWTQTLPQSESQARPLTSLEPEVQREAWAQVVAENETDSITAKKVGQGYQKSGILYFLRYIFDSFFHRMYSG